MMWYLTCGLEEDQIFARWIRQGCVIFQVDYTRYEFSDTHKKFYYAWTKLNATEVELNTSEVMGDSLSQIYHHEEKCVMAPKHDYSSSYNVIDICK